MAEFKRFYRCEICGNLVQVEHSGAGELVCCGKPMKLLEEKKEDDGNEKHVPVIQGNKVKVGSVAHPMEEAHFIEFIWATDGKQDSIVFLKPGQAPEAEFCFNPIEAKEYCTVHGLWKSK